MYRTTHNADPFPPPAPPGFAQVTLAPNTWYDTSDIQTQQQFGYEAGFDLWATMMSGGVSTAGSDLSNTTRTKTLDTLYLIFESNDGSTLLTPQKLEFIKSVEQSVLGLDKFSDYCQVRSGFAANIAHSLFVAFSARR